MITIDSNPSAFLRAGLNTLLEAGVLVLICRAGLSGISIKDMASALRCPLNTVQSIARRLVVMELVGNPQRGTGKGRGFLYQTTSAGAGVVNAAIVAVPYVTTGAQTPLNLDS